jgi:hypothetical protein
MAILRRSFVAALLLGCSFVRGDTTPKPVAARMRADLTFLASDACEGRGPGTAGIDKAADYIAAALRTAGLHGAMPDGSFFQPFIVRGSPSLEPGAEVSLTGPGDDVKRLALKDDFQIIGLSGSGTATAPVVFAGYGITCPEPSYDDYHGIDVSGKVVLLIRRAPRYGDKDHPFADDQTMQQHAALQTKIANAAKHKAAAVLLVNDASEKDDPLMEFGYASGAAGSIPAAQIKRTFADALLKSTVGKSLAEIEQAIAKDLTPAGAALRGCTATVSATVERKKIPVKNVVGVLDGVGPLADETVVIGAHYDHLGYGGTGSGSLAAGTKAIHHGADDNGSGTTTIIELARRFGGDKSRVGRRLVFIAFSGEEMGLLGSKHYVDHPLYPLDSTVAMVNLDMVGRLAPDPNTGKGKLEVGGTGSAKQFDALIDRLNGTAGFEVKKNKAGVGPSDHTSFYLKGVPVFFLFTGLHRQYHKPTDTVDLINFQGMEQIADLAETLVRHLSTDTPRPEYVKGQGSLFTGGRMSVPRLGFMPGNYDDDADGVLIGSVTKGGPADKGGVKDNDRIIAVAGEPIKNMTTYMLAMGKQKKNQPCEITVVRDGKQLKLTVTPE